MEPRLVLANNGQQLILDDVNLLGETAGLADDRVLAELLRMPAYNGSTVSRGIIPAALFGNLTSATSFPQVGTNGASGSVLVQPFRAVIGSRTAVATDVKKNWRDIRSAMSLGSATLAQTISLAANASGNPRWDLIYAVVAVDANGASITRKIKNPTTKVIAGTSVVTTLVTTVTLAVQQGTAAASPVWPTAPADAGSTYYIPLAYVRVPNGFTATSTVASTDIALVANMLGTAPIEGGSMSIATLNQQKNLGTTPQGAWGSTGTPQYQSAPAIAQGTESLLIFIDLTSGTANFASGGIVDSSRDWSKRYFRWSVGAAFSYGGAGSGFAHRGGVGGNPSGIGAAINTASGANSALAIGMGNSFATSPGAVLSLFPASASSGANLNMIPAASSFLMSVNSSGQLVATTTGSPVCQLVVWLEATARFEV